MILVKYKYHWDVLMLRLDVCTLLSNELICVGLGWASNYCRLKWSYGYNYLNEVG
jgi:hypothetical protein